MYINLPDNLPLESKVRYMLRAFKCEKYQLPSEIQLVNELNEDNPDRRIEK